MICHFEGTKIGVFWLHCSARLLLPVILDGYSLEECFISPGISQSFIHDHLPLHLYINFNRQSHKMIKHTQTIRRQIADELFECVCPFCEIGAKRVNDRYNVICTSVIYADDITFYYEFVALSWVGFWIYMGP